MRDITSYHKVHHHDKILDKKHLLSYPYIDGVERSFLITDKKSVKYVYNKLKNNPHFETDVDIDNKIIHIYQDNTVINNIKNEHKNRREKEHDHYKIKSFNDYNLILTYMYHDHVVEHLSPPNHGKMILILLVVLSVLAAVSYYLIQSNTIDIKKLQDSVSSMVDSVKKSITE